MGKKKHKGSKGTSKAVCVSGTGQLAAALTNTNAAGAFVATRYEIDTAMLTSWGQLGQTFAKWRPKKLRFRFVPIKGTTTEGVMGIVHLPDVGMTTPVSTAQCLSNEKANMGSIHQPLSLDVKPKHTGWLFTRDSVATTDDRLEMPGDIVFFSDSTTASYIPGYAIVDYVIEFDDVTNANVAPMLKECTTELKVDPETLDLAKKIQAMKKPPSSLG